LGSGDEDVDAGMLHVNPHAAAGYAVKHEEGSYTLDENEKGKATCGVCVSVCMRACLPLTYSVSSSSKLLYVVVGYHDSSARLDMRRKNHWRAKR